jgi:hypothetical protein
MSTYVLNTDKDRGRVLDNLKRFLDALPAEKAWAITIAPQVKKRTDPQNHALFGVAYPPLVAHTGYRPEEIHEVMCMGYFGKVEYEVLGVLKVRPYRTTTKDENGKRSVLSTTEFSEFYAYVQQRGAELGIFIDEPNPMRGAA